MLDADSTTFFAVTATLLGLSAGLTPGPLTALVISQTLRFGFREGAVVGLAPILTDGPLVIISAVAITQAGEVEGFLGILSLAGAAFLGYLAWDSLAASALALEDAAAEAPKSLRKSLVANMLNPHAYLFWFVLGGPLVARSVELGGPRPWVFLIVFFACLVGAKITIAWIVARTRHLLAGKGYVWVMRALGGALGVFAVLFFMDGLNKLG